MVEVTYRKLPGGRVLTLHREANVTPEPLARIAEALAEIGEPVIFPAHPRTSSTLAQAGIALPPNVAMIPPAGYLDFAALDRTAYGHYVVEAVEGRQVAGG